MSENAPTRSLDDIDLAALRTLSQEPLRHLQRWSVTQNGMGRAMEIRMVGSCCLLNLSGFIINLASEERL
ncbi:hypothetical protein JZ751_022832 [Albula glossodonta]|uniref:Uncharacterized protein n=1 Tax=Albula glossodonta TaxID=121402 RepID=A0A8T2PK61_9TELE|nr:hypothetical protein JZ751_022832 [Albula glossodonta]